MRISLFGIGYVGAVAAACLVRDGHSVIAVDTNPQKIDLLNRGLSSVVEPDLQTLIHTGVAGGRLRAVISGADAVAQTEVSIVCVGSPGGADGALDPTAVLGVAALIGAVLATKDGVHTVVVRSTLGVGTMAGRILPEIERISGRKAGPDFGVAYYPEFLREGSAIRDYGDPSQAVVAVTDERTLMQVQRLHPPAAPPLSVVSFEEAEAIKAVGNVWHAVKVAFANEIGGLLSRQGLDSHAVMDAVCRDRRLNISAAYLRPGFAFGGSCLPKDLRAFAASSPAPLLGGAVEANDAVIERAAALVDAAGGRRVLIVGLAFKPGTDDLRESPYLLLAERLVERGVEVRLFDPDVRADRLTGANRAYAAERAPDLEARLCGSLEEAVEWAQTLVLAHAGIGAAALDLAQQGHRIVDLVRVRPGLRTGGSYQGLFW